MVLTAVHAQTTLQDSNGTVAGKPAKCRAISADIRAGKPMNREAVISELIRARKEGEMDYYISSTPPATFRPMCDLPSGA